MNDRALHGPSRVADAWSLSFVASLLVLICIALPAAAERSATAVRVESPPVVDGRLDDACWAGAPATDGFIDVFKQEPVSEKTSVRFCYDEEAMYVAFECFESRLPEISTAVSSRDNGNMFDYDDAVAVLFDTFHDHRSCYVLGANAAGTKLDLHSSECGASSDSGWDAIWDVATARSEDRWTAEFAIPFSELRCADAEGEVVWGLEMVRTSTPGRELQRWVESGNEITDASCFGHLTGLRGIESSSGLHLLPYAMGRYDLGDGQDYPLEPEDSGWNVHPDAGLDIEYALTRGVTLNATINPDYAQIEADPNQINLTGDELWLEERRPFFSENADVYSMPLTLLYTRRMEDIDFGAKATGKVADGDFAALYVRSDDLPRDENGTPLCDGETGEPLAAVGSDYGVLTYKHNLFTNATLGGFLAGRDREGDDCRVGAALLGLSPLEGLRLNGLAAVSSNPDDEGDDEAYALEWRYDDGGLESYGEVRWIGEGFSPEMGFVSQDARGQSGGHFEVSKRLDIEGERIDYWQLSADGGRFESIDGELESYWASGEASVTTAGYLNFELGLERRHDAVDYPEHPERTILTAQFATNAGGWHGLGLIAAVGDYHNSDYAYGHAGLYLQPVDPLTLSITGQAVTLRNDRDLDWAVERLRANYRFSREMFLRGIVQGEYTRYGFEGGDLRSQRYDVSLLYGWEFSPGSNFYLAYNQAMDREDGKNTFEDPVLVAKVSYMISI